MFLREFCRLFGFGRSLLLVWVVRVGEFMWVSSWVFMVGLFLSLVLSVFRFSRGSRGYLGFLFLRL